MAGAVDDFGNARRRWSGFYRSERKRMLLNGCSNWISWSLCVRDTSSAGASFNRVRAFEAAGSLLLHCNAFESLLLTRTYTVGWPFCGTTMLRHPHAGAVVGLLARCAITCVFIYVRVLTLVRLAPRSLLFLIELTLAWSSPSLFVGDIVRAR
ncbi:hypothetical protein WI664_10350 [Vibrio cholerae]